MNRFFRHPLTNAVGLSVFSGFYAVIFLGFSGLIKSQIGCSVHSFWQGWDTLLEGCVHQVIAVVLLILTGLVLALLLIKHKPYDEYHTTILVQCLAIAVILTLAAIAMLFIVVLWEPVGVIGKFAFFALVNWAVVVVADLSYLLICRRQ
ncbi:MAG: hypothetical protein LBS74_02205 [Oscillospiraceae bacterium]|jgi:hypothetical protein|nr:hypothetical protein [Oscillospiraceae bacterium]